VKYFYDLSRATSPNPLSYNSAPCTFDFAPNHGGIEFEYDWSELLEDLFPASNAAQEQPNGVA
jgi:hypothetical protein